MMWLIIIVALLAPLDRGWAAAASGKLAAPLVDWNDAKQAQALVRQWLVQGKVPTKASGSIKVSGVIGIRITLRTLGVMAGKGDAYRRHLSTLVNHVGPAVDMTPLIKQAARHAFASVRNHLKDLQLRAMLTGNNGQMVKLPKLSEIADRLQIGVQVATQLTAIHVPTGAKSGAIFHMFAPDYHGLRMTGAHGQGQAFIWPATALARNVDPESQLYRLLSRIGLGPGALDTIARPGGPKLQRFDVIQVVRPRVGMPVMHLIRGNELLPAHSITGPTLDDIAQRLTGALRQRIIPGEQVLRGTYHPTTQMFDPAVASNRSAGLACYALTVQAAHRLSEGSHDDEAKAFAHSALSIVQRMAGTGSGKHLSPAAGALVLMTMVDSPVGGVDKAVRDRLAHWLMGLANAKGGFHLAGKKQAALSSATEALITAALAQWYARTRDAAAGKIVSRSLQAVWQQMQKNVNISALPWLMIAQNKAGDLLKADGLAGSRQAVAAREVGLAKLVSALVNRQVETVPAAGPADVVGGYQLTTIPQGAPPTPDWHSAEVLTFISAALRNKAVTRGQDQLGWILSAGLGVRFIGQLMIAQPSCFYIQDQQDAMGAVRVALWNNRLPVSATAMSLLGVTTLQDMLASTASGGEG